MSALSLPELPWLTRPASDFRNILKRIGEMPRDESVAALIQLASSYLNPNQLYKLASARNKLKQSRGSSLGLTKFKLGIVSNGTTDFVIPALEATALRYRIDLEIIGSGFDQVAAQAFDPSSSINSASPDAILILLNQHGLPFRAAEEQTSGSPNDHQQALEFIQQVVQGFRAGCGSPSILHTITVPSNRQFGSLDLTMRGTQGREVYQFNLSLADFVASSDNYLVDIDWLSTMVGNLAWVDEKQWFHARLPFSQSMLPLYGDFVCRTIAAIRGKSRKCLVVDLDNTLWGGVIGDDGLEGIRMQPGDPVGEAYLDVQRTLLDLKERGIILAVCSKNNEVTAREVFKKHHDILLKEEDFAVFLANWSDKASNIEHIADRLDIGLDAIAFLDDNPVERDQVRTALPLVAVPELPDDPSLFSKTLLLSGLFESVSFTEEDRKKTEQYLSNAKRKEILKASRSIEEYLASLEMKISFRPFDEAGRKRIVQLINKTNQFNLTTRRYTESEVVSMEEDSDTFTLQVSLTDKFGNNGMICVVVCQREGTQWTIDSWLMSCRVIKRDVEKEVCNYLVEKARERGIETIVGLYIPTDRNKLVADHYSALGFTRIPADDDTIEYWTLKVTDYVPFSTPMVRT